MNKLTPRPLVSAVIINWNGRRWLPRLLDSLLPQLTPFSSEVILADNASTDDSVALVRECYPGVIIARGTANRGYAAGVNLGLAHARGEWLLVLNTDLAFPPGSIAALLEAAQSRPRLGLASPLLVDDTGALTFTYGYEADERVLLARMFNLQRHSSAAAQRDLEVKPSAHGLDVQPVPYLVGACLLVRRSALEQVGPMDERFFMYFEDVDWSRRFRQAGWEVAMLRATKVIHSGGGSSGGASSSPVSWYYVSLLLYARKHYGALRALILHTIAILTHAKSWAVTWVRSRLPKGVPGAVAISPEDYQKVQAFHLRALRLLFQPGYK